MLLNKRILMISYFLSMFSCFSKLNINYSYLLITILLNHYYWDKSYCLIRITAELYYFQGILGAYIYTKIAMPRNRARI